MNYTAPTKDMLFVMNELADLNDVNQLPGCEEATPELVAAILEESARFCGEVLAPMNAPADQAPSYWKEGKVYTAKGFKEAYNTYCESGWQGLQHPPEFGGQGLPKLVGTACAEMVQSANLSFALGPLLTDGAVESLLVAGSQELKDTFLPNLISGQWAGTMNLTEPQAGSDLAAVRTRAVKQSDGTYRVSGTKCFITYGDHDLTENIIHMVLARTPDAPEGVKGISLFIVPKVLINTDGSLGADNDVQCVSIEHKMGIKASPTAVLQFGDHGGSVGYLVGEENRGLEYMFIMMNAARFGVGMQGIGVSERAYQQAVAFSKERIQSRALDGGKEPVTIIHHPDVRRMLMSMKSQTEAARALAYYAASLSDVAHHHADEATRKAALARYEFLVPIVKGWSTEIANDITSTNIQIHGGMGFIEETGAAQYYRDARILAIYEGTTAIQSNDFVGRKTARDGGAVAGAFAAQIRQTIGELEAAGCDTPKAIAVRLAEALSAFERTVTWVVANAKANPKATYAGSVLYMVQAGYLFGGWQLARAAMIAGRKVAAGDSDTDFLKAKIATARFYVEQFLPRCAALETAVVSGGTGALELAEDQF